MRALIFYDGCSQSKEVAFSFRIKTNQNKCHIPCMLACHLPFTQHSIDLKFVLCQYAVLIHQAVKKKSWRYRLLLQMALANGEDPDRPSAEGITPLMLACVAEQDWAIDRLLEEGADRRMLEKDMAYLVVKCDAQNKTHMIDDLQARGVDFSRSIFYEILATAPGQQKSLGHGDSYSKTSRINELLKEGDVNLRELSTGYTALHFAVLKQNTRAVMELVDIEEVKVDVYDNEGYTALHRCLLQDDINLDILEGLLGSPYLMSMNETQEGATTTLHFAVRSGRVDIVKKLLEALAQTQEPSTVAEMINRKNDMGKSPLHLATELGSTQIVDKLLQYGGDPKRRNGEECNCLHVAAQEGHASLVALLMAKNIDPYLTGKRQGRTALHFACLANSLATVRILLSRPESRDQQHLNFGDKKGCTALHHSVQVGDLQIARMLLKAGIKTDEPTNDDKYAIQIATEKNNLEMVKLLLEYGADVNVCGSAGKTALDIAKELKHDKIEVLLKQNNGMRASHFGAKNKGNKVASGTELHKLVKLNELRFLSEEEISMRIQSVLETGVNINDRDDDSMTVLHIAAQCGSLAIVKALLMEGDIDVNAENKNGYTPLHVASESGNLLIVESFFGIYKDKEAESPTFENKIEDSNKAKSRKIVMMGARTLKRSTIARHDVSRTSSEKLEAADASPYSPREVDPKHLSKLIDNFRKDLNNETKDERRTPLELAVKNRHFEIAEIFINEGSDINHIANDGMGSLHLACRNGDFKMVQMLLNAGIQLHGSDDFGRSELHHACESANEDVVDILLQVKDIPTDTFDHDMYTPWHRVAASTDPKASNIMRKLMQLSNVDVNLQGPQEKTALHLAVRAGNMEVVKEIIKCPNLQINARDKDGATPLHIAARERNENIVVHLIETYRDEIDLNARTNNNLTPLDVAFAAGNTKVKNVLRKYGTLRSFQLSRNLSLSNSDGNRTSSGIGLEKFPSDISDLEV